MFSNELGCLDFVVHVTALSLLVRQVESSGGKPVKLCEFVTLMSTGQTRHANDDSRKLPRSRGGS